MNYSSIEEIAAIIDNQLLASSIHDSVTSALDSPFVHLVTGQTVWDVFKHSLDAAILEIEDHERSEIFRRLITYGPLNPDDSEALIRDEKRTLSDAECGTCVDFIFSHMVNRFKGEVAELLALGPCIALMRRLYKAERLSARAQLYWGDLVRERRRIRIGSGKGDTRWGAFTKGADGVLVERIPIQQENSCDLVKIHGVVEVKSMVRSQKTVLEQIHRHIMRLAGGVKLGEEEWSTKEVDISFIESIRKKNSTFHRIIVMPSTWKLSRKWVSMKTDAGRKIELPESSKPPRPTRIEEVEPNLWRITLAWSQEALEQAAYEMTSWYMSQVSKSVYAMKKLPRGWEDMTSEQAGYNAIKMMLYYILLRPLSARQLRVATKLYNVHCFSYPLGAKGKEMLWLQISKIGWTF